MSEHCPDIDKHTPCPTEYLAWHEWAHEMRKTHTQLLCPGCLLYKIWTPKLNRAQRRARR